MKTIYESKLLFIEWYEYSVWWEISFGKYYISLELGHYQIQIGLLFLN